MVLLAPPTLSTRFMSPSLDCVASDCVHDNNASRVTCPPVSVGMSDHRGKAVGMPFRRELKTQAICIDNQLLLRTELHGRFSMRMTVLGMTALIGLAATVQLQAADNELTP